MRNQAMKEKHTHTAILRVASACIATIGIVAAVHAVDTAAQQDCRLIEDDASRLACYDRPALPPKPEEIPQPVEADEEPPQAQRAPPQEVPEAAPPTVVPVEEKVPALAAPAAAETPATVPAATSPAAAGPVPLDDEVGKEALGRDKEDEVVIRGTVVRCTQDVRKKYLFYFDNGQIWKQKDNTKIRWKECAFDVTITRDFFGYRMTPVGETRRVRIARVK